MRDAELGGACAAADSPRRAGADDRDLVQLVLIDLPTIIARAGGIRAARCWNCAGPVLLVVLATVACSRSRPC